MIGLKAEWLSTARAEIILYHLAILNSKPLLEAVKHHTISKLAEIFRKTHNKLLFQLIELRRKLFVSRRLWMRRFHIPLRLRGGVKINSHRIQSQWIVNSLIEGLYEGQEARSIETLIQPDDSVLELGSGLGYIACLAAKRAHRGRVLSYEANPKMVDLAKETIQLNSIDNVEIRNGILASKLGTRNFYLSEHFWESSLEPNPDWTMISIVADSIQEVLGTFRPNVLIVDIEGGEYELFKTSFWDSNESLKKMSIEFHKCEDPHGRFSKLNFDGWEPNRNLDEVQNDLCNGHQILVFSRL